MTRVERIYRNVERAKGVIELSLNPRAASAHGKQCEMRVMALTTSIHGKDCISKDSVSFSCSYLSTAITLVE